MKELGIKQKTIIGIISILAIGIIGFYLYTQTNNNDSEIMTEENILINNEINKKNAQEEEEDMIIVHITGEVMNSGIVKLKEGSRIIDAIEAAGGSTEKADFNEINLAYVLEDGQKIYIPNIEERKEDSEKEYITTNSGNNVIIEGNNIEKEKKVMININTATLEELMKLPGIGESTASKILAYRNENGKFGTIEDLRNVNGIGEAKYNNIKDNITVK